MGKYFKAATNVVGLPTKMVFIDKSGQGHLLPTLTPKKHTIASHYGHPAIVLNNKRGNLVKVVQKGEYTSNYLEDKVKKTRVRKTAADKEKAIADKEAKRAAREQKKAEREALKAEKQANKAAAKEAKKAEREAKKAEARLGKMAQLDPVKVYNQRKKKVNKKIAATAMADDMFNSLLATALPKPKRGRPKKK
jgi:flagellar biosynthesis GTPase FlhF